MAPARVLVVSDTHLSDRAPEAATNWEAVVTYARRHRPDLVVHLGDATLHGNHDPDELALARRHLDRLPAPWVAIPGNHDIGDNPSPGLPARRLVDRRRLADWRATVGADHFHAEIAGVHLVGINGMLADTGWADESRQWSWLEDTIGAIGDEPVVLASHKPVAGEAAEIAAVSATRYAPPAACRRLADLLDRADAPLVLSGHVHQQRLVPAGGRTHAWAPTTWAVMPEAVQPTVGLKRCGVLVLTLDAGAVTGLETVEPPDLSQHTLGEDVANPYS